MTKILVVEDESEVREDIVEVLELEGYDVVEACDGLDGIKQAVKHNPDLIISDVSMPKLDGLNFFKKLHADHPDTSDVPFLFLTAHADRESELTGREMGASDYLTKPVDFELLLARLKSQLVSSQKASRQINRKLKELLKETGGIGILTSSGNDQKMFDDLLTRYQKVLDDLTEPLTALQNLDYALASYKTPKEAKNIAMVLSKACPNPETAAMGYIEIFVNAVEHGNLGLSYEDKTRLLNDGTWQDEIERRLKLEKYKDRKVSLTLERCNGQLRVQVKDEGDGFDYEQYMELDPKRMGHLHGRGIAFANTISFNSLCYQGNGNQVVTVIDLPDEETAG